MSWRKLEPAARSTRAQVACYVAVDVVSSPSLSADTALKV